jgi:predicted nucleic acid-binding protein
LTALLVDAGALLAQANANDRFHDAVVNVLSSERGPLITSQLVAAEADYMVLRRLGIDSELAFIADLASDTYSAECLTLEELDSARAIVAQYRDLEVGLADASLIVLARRFQTRRILTLDERCFRAMAPLQGGSFTLLPAEA